jgi:hypothetical protein
MEVDSFYLLTSGDMHEHLELGALLGEMAQMLHPHHVYIQRNIISTAVQVQAYFSAHNN